MTILTIDGHHYRYGAEQVVDPSRKAVGYMGFIAPATTSSGTSTTAASFLTWQMPPSPLFETASMAEDYIFEFIVLNHRRQADGTGFPAGSRIANLRTRVFGTVVRPVGYAAGAQLQIQVDNGGTQLMPESDLVLVPST